MNNKRRKEIQQKINAIEQLKEELEQIGENEIEAFQNLPESIQETEKGEVMESNGEELLDRSAELEALRERLEEII